MITSEDVSFTNKKHQCFHCKKELRRDENVLPTNLYVIHCGAISMPDYFPDRAGTFKRIMFHEECFAEIAGEEYMFSKK